jgi:hypothetical protein
MPCYSPLIRIEDTSKWLKATDGHYYHPAKIQKASNILGERLEDMDEKTENILWKYGYTPIPCGNCIGCRLDYSREWANRGYLEAKCWEQNYFVTLTYDDEHLTKLDFTEDDQGFTYSDPEWNGTLVPKDFTQFIKSLRQIMKRDYNEEGIRFMGCGEYGEEGERPHYHLIFFNLNLPVETFYSPKIKNGNTYWQNKIIERAWDKGISNISDATWNTIAYTARYITKKINGKTSSQHYAELGQRKEFFRVSRMPGIGYPYYEKYKDEIYKNDNIIIKNKEGAIASKPPKYFDKLYEQENPEKFRKIKIKRSKQARNSARIKDTTHNYGRLKELEIEAISKSDQTSSLKRNLEKKIGKT